jgi:hypothetical protein
MFSRSFKLKHGYDAYAKLSIPLLSSLAGLDESRLYQAYKGGLQTCPSGLNRSQFGMSKVYDVIANETSTNRKVAQSREEMGCGI